MGGEGDERGRPVSELERSILDVVLHLRSNSIYLCSWVPHVISCARGERKGRGCVKRGSSVQACVW